MWTNEVAPIFDQVGDTIIPNENWSKLFDAARQETANPGEVLGFYMASMAIEYGDFSDLKHVQDDCIRLTKPRMTRQEKTQFKRAFGRMGALEDAFVVMTNQIEDAREGVSI